MKTTIRFAVIGIAAFMLIGSARAFAQGSCFTMVDRIPGITLDETQKAVLTAKEVEHRKKMIRLRADFAVAHVDKENLVKDRNFKKAAAEKQIRTMMGIETEMELARLEALDELRKVLTDEQWAVFISHMPRKGGAKGMACPRGGMPEGHHMGKGHGMGAASDDSGARDGAMKNCPFAGQAAQE